MKDAIREFVERELLAGSAAISDADNLLEDGMLDSMDVVRLVAFAEKQLDRRIPPQDVTYENFQSVEKLVDYLQSLQNAAK